MIVGVLGGGQLGRLLALAGYSLGLRFRFLDPSPDASAGQLAELLVGDYLDASAMDRFRNGIDVATYEFESVPAAAVRSLARQVPVFPPPDALEVAQDRLNEKLLFDRIGIPTPLYAPVDSEADLRHALDRIGLPAVLKTRRCGYDGKGQLVLRRHEEAWAAWDTLGRVPLILEQFVPFERELSIVAVRGRTGEAKFYPLVENRHGRGILRLSLAPAPALSPELQRQAEGYAVSILEAVDYVGVLAVEFFHHDGRLLANEMAPRVHNSGHWTIEGAETSQFENHLRAILGLPLGSTAALGHAAMLNVIGDIPPLEKILAIPGAHLHLYGKTPVPDRKLGHVTICHPTSDSEVRSRLALLMNRTEGA